MLCYVNWSISVYRQNNSFLLFTTFQIQEAILRELIPQELNVPSKYNHLLEYYSSLVAR